MPVSPDTGSKFAGPVADLMAQHELTLLEGAAKALRGDQTREEWGATTTARIRKWREQADKAIPGALDELGKAVRTALLGAQEAGAVAALVDLPGVPSSQPLDSRGVTLSEDKLGKQLAEALQQTPRILERVLREAVRAGVDDVRAGTTTRRGGAQRVLDNLMRQGVTGFRDTAGRSWSLSSYAEMAVRTETQAAALAAGEERIKALGLDLVIVSDSPRECPLCRPYEGKILSLGDLPADNEIQQTGSDTPVPSQVGAILDKWVGLDGSAKLTRADRAKVTTAVVTHGKQPPPVLYRGVNMGKVPASLGKPGQAVHLPASSTSEDFGSAAPYAEADDGVPVLFEIKQARRGLSVSDRAESVSGYSEAEWIVAGPYYVQKDRMEDGIRVIVLGQSPPPSSGNQSLKKPLDMTTFLPPEPPKLPGAESTPPKPTLRVTRPSELGGLEAKVDVFATLDEARSAGFQHPNCTHSFSGYVPGVTTPKPADANPEGYKQKERQRAMERKIREWKRAQVLALDPDTKRAAGAKVRDWQGALRDHIKDNDLKRQSGRESITRAV